MNSRLLQDLKLLFSPHYLINILLSISFLLFKNVPPFCNILFPNSECQLDFREKQILMFILVVIGLRTRKKGISTMLPYISSVCQYVKAGNCLLYFFSDLRLGFIYVVLCIVHLVFLPEPVYKGPDSIIYFKEDTLEEEIKQDKRVNWLIAFYASWNPTCVAFAPVYAQLSMKYNLDNLKFGKIDVSRFPDIARKYGINTSPFSQQLPTVILFQNGVPVTKRPSGQAGSSTAKFYFSEMNIIMAFNLNQLYQECKDNPIKKRKMIEEQHPKEE